MYDNENKGFGPFDNETGGPYGGQNETVQTGVNPPWQNGSGQTGQSGINRQGPAEGNPNGIPWENPNGMPWMNPNGQPPYSEPRRPYYGAPAAGPDPYGIPPVYQNSAQQPNMPYSQAPGGVYASNKNSGLAIACFVLSILGFLTGIFFVGIALDVLAFILGIVALTQNSKKKGLPVTGMILSVLSILLTFAFYYAISLDQDASVRGIKNPEMYIPTVEEKAASSVLMENITLEDYVTSRELILIYDNKNDFNTQLEITVTYYDDNDDLLFLRSSYISSCAAQGRAAVDIALPYDKNYNDIPYSRYEVDTIAKQTNPQYDTPNYGKEFKIKSNIGIQGGVIASITNPTGKTFDSVGLMCVYYKNGAAVGRTTEYISEMGKSAAVEFSAPYDKDYNDLDYDDYEIFVNSTDIYN